MVRQATPADAVQWRSLWQGYNAFYGRSGPTALPADITDATWARFLDPAEPMHALVAESAGALVGLAHYLYHRSTTMLQPTCYLQDLYTSEGARGRGVATALIHRVAEEARGAGSSRLYWQTHESNASARKLYDRIAEYSGFLVYRISLQEPTAPLA